MLARKFKFLPQTTLTQAADQQLTFADTRMNTPPEDVKRT